MQCCCIVLYCFERKIRASRSKSKEADYSYYYYYYRLFLSKPRGEMLEAKAAYAEHNKNLSNMIPSEVI